MSALNVIRCGELAPLRNNVFVSDLDSGARRTPGGLIIPDDDMSIRGIRPRWAKVWAIGPDVKRLEVGQWVLIEHGRWTEKIMIELEDETSFPVWRIDWPKAGMAISDTDPRVALPTSL